LGSGLQLVIFLTYRFCDVAEFYSAAQECDATTASKLFTKPGAKICIRYVQTDYPFSGKWISVNLQADNLSLCT